MNGFQHKELAQGRWQTMPFSHQMANIGSEISRALNWRTKGDKEYSQKAFYRGLELLDLTMADPKNIHRLKEIARTREALVDYFEGWNEIKSSEESWRKYFDHFGYAARKDC